MNESVHSQSLNFGDLPPLQDLSELESNFCIGRTTAYHLASAGEIQSLTLGAPGKRGKRVFLTASVVDYVRRRLAASTPLNCSNRHLASDSK